MNKERRNDRAVGVSIACLRDEKTITNTAWVIAFCLIQKLT